MKTNKWTMTVGLFFLIPGLFFGIPVAGEVSAAGYPERPISLVVPYAPGGITDMSARTLAGHMEKHLKQPIVVVNKPGGASTIGGYAVASANPDGYTIGFFPDVTSLPEVFSYFFEAPYTSKNLRPMTKMYTPVLGFFVNGDAPWNTMKEFIEYARKNPGTKVGHPGKMTPGFAVMNMFNKAEKVGLIDVPFDSDAKVLPAVLGGHIPIGHVGFPQIRSLYEAKKVKILVLTTIEKRATFAPEIPTLNELGYRLTGASFQYFGLFGPKGVPDEVVKKIDEAVRKVCEEPEFLSVAEKMGSQISYMDGPKFEKSLAEYKEVYLNYFKEQGLVK